MFGSHHACWFEPRHFMPTDLIPTCVHNASHSSMLCLVSMMLHVFSCVEICAMMSRMNHRFAGSIPVEGSSRRLMTGLPIMAKMEPEVAVVRALAFSNLPS